MVHQGVRAHVRKDWVNNQELFAYTCLRDLYSAMEKANWEVASNSKIKSIVRSKPSLRKDFTYQPNEKFKRKFHVLQILGECANILCKKTTVRGKRA